MKRFDKPFEKPIDKTDKPLKVFPLFDELKIKELFDLAQRFDTHEILKYSLDQQIPLNVQNDEGDCLIHAVLNTDIKAATEHAKLNVIKFLVQNKVNPEKPNKYNQTPLHLACKKQYCLIIEYLLKLGVNINFQDNIGNTPLHYLLTGIIDIDTCQKEVKDFISKKKDNKDEQYDENVMKEIKRLLYDYIMDNSVPNAAIQELPLQPQQIPGKLPVVSVPNVLQPLSPVSPVRAESLIGYEPNQVYPQGYLEIQTYPSLVASAPAPLAPLLPAPLALPTIISYDSNKIPLLETLKTTIEAMINHQPEIIDRKKAILEKINQDTKHRNTTIEGIKNDIRKKIKNKFNSERFLTNFEIHKKEAQSWTPNDENYGLIKEGNIKTRIKQVITTISNEILEYNNNFKPLSISDDPYKNGFNTVMQHYISSFEVEEPKRMNFYMIKNSSFDFDKFKDVNDELRHFLALDDADDIIDFENLKFIEGPRQINLRYFGYTDINLMDKLIIDTYIYNGIQKLFNIFEHDDNDNMDLIVYCTYVNDLRIFNGANIFKYHKEYIDIDFNSEIIQLVFNVEDILTEQRSSILPQIVERVGNLTQLSELLVQMLQTMLETTIYVLAHKLSPQKTEIQKKIKESMLGKIFLNGILINQLTHLNYSFDIYQILNIQLTMHEIQQIQQIQNEINEMLTSQQIQYIQDAVNKINIIQQIYLAIKAAKKLAQTINNTASQNSRLPNVQTRLLQAKRSAQAAAFDAAAEISRRNRYPEFPADPINPANPITPARLAANLYVIQSTTMPPWIFQGIIQKITNFITNQNDELTQILLIIYQIILITLIDKIPILSDLNFIPSLNEKQIYFNKYCLTLLIHYAKFKQDKFDNILNFTKFIAVHFNLNTHFINKWHKIYIKKRPNLSYWIYSMYCDLECMQSDDNLACTIDFELLLLLNGLNNYNNVKKGMLHACKPYIIPHIMDEIKTTIINNPSSNLKISETLMVLLFIIILLNDNIDLNFMSNILKFKNILNQPLSNYQDLYNIFFSYLNSLNLDEALLKLIKEILKILDEQDKTIIKNKIMNEILLYTKGMATKLPIKTFIDFFTILNNIDFYTFNNTKLLLQNISPIKRQTNKQTNIRFVIADIMGLYYEGILNNINYHGKYKIIKNQKQHINLIDLNTDFHSLLNNPIPLILNYVYYEQTVQDKYNYKGIINEFRPPTFHNYLLTILKNIKNCQELIKIEANKMNNIISSLVVGNSSQLKELYTEIYPKIVIYQYMVESYKKSFDITDNYYAKNKNEEIRNLYKEIKTEINYANPQDYDYDKLAEQLNKLNSHIFLYYYLYQPGNLIKISRFSYYQIPTKNDKREMQSNFRYYNFDEELKIFNGKLSSANGLFATTNIYKELSIIYNFISGNYNNIVEEYKKGFFTTVENINNQLITQNISNWMLLRFNDIMQGNFPTIINSNNEHFIMNKNSKLPMSLVKALPEFYEYSLIEIVKHIVTQLDYRQDPRFIQIYDETKKLLKNKHIGIDDNLRIYLVVAKFTEQIVKECINFYIDENINKWVLDTTMTGGAISAPAKRTNINLLDVSIDFDISKIIDVKKNKNLSILSVNLPKCDEAFILYPNDFTNLNRLKSKDFLKISKKAVINMLTSRAAVYTPNLEGQMPIIPIIKNYNHDLLKIFNKYLIDSRQNNLITKFIIKENFNNLYKLLGNNVINKNTKMKTIISNIDNNLYTNIYSLITAIDSYGNTVIKYLPESFNISSYLILHYLSASLHPEISDDIIFLTSDLDNILKIVNEINETKKTETDKNDENKINCDDVKKLYINTKISKYDIPDNISIFLFQDLIKEKEEELEKLNAKIKEITNTIEKANDTDKHFLEKKLITYNKKLQEIQNKIDKFKSFSSNYSKFDLPIKVCKSYEDLVELPKDEELTLFIKAWSKLLDDELMINSNLLPIYILYKQKLLIEKINNAMEKNDLTTKDIDDIKQIEKVMGYFSAIAESYFNNGEYVDNNNVLAFINSSLEYITKLVICTNIELIIRKVLFISLKNAQYNSVNYDDINEKVNLVLDGDIYYIVNDNQTKKTTLIKELYKNVANKLVKNAAEIFINKDDKETHNNENIKDILQSYFELLKLVPVQEIFTEEIMEIFTKDVVNYFDIFVHNIIKLWHVNIENILKYFINNYRCLKTLFELVNITKLTKQD